MSDLASDQGRPVTTVVNDPVILRVLEDASERIRAAARVGNRYTEQDLTTLAGTSSYLKRLTCDIAFGLLVGRRGQAAAQIASLAPLYVDALRALEQLQSGVPLLGVTGADDKHPAAGLPSTAALGSGGRDPLSSQVRLFGTVNLPAGY